MGRGVTGLDHRRGRIVMAAAIACAVAIGWSRWLAAHTARQDDPSRRGTQSARSEPLRVGSAIALPGGFRAGEANEILGRLRMKHPGSLSIMLHAVRLFGPGVDFAQPGSGRRVKALDIALDVREGRAFFGPNPCLIETRSGIRNLVAPRSRADRARSPERQAHVDQLLAALAEAGVPTDHPITSGTKGGTVRSILDDSLANFDLKQEIEWTGLAFALYLPPQRGWSDRFGRRYTFDDLVAEMMARPFDREGISCEGTHLLYSLAVILRVDRDEPVLSPSSRLALREHMAENVSRALASQGPDGAPSPAPAGRWAQEGPIGPRPHPRHGPPPRMAPAPARRPPACGRRAPASRPLASRRTCPCDRSEDRRRLLPLLARGPRADQASRPRLTWARPSLRVDVSLRFVASW